jgi:hypothetical protein
VIDIDIRDAQARPDLWEMLETPKVAGELVRPGKAEPEVKAADGEPSPFKALAARLFRPWMRPNPLPLAPLPTAQPAAVRPDVDRVTRFAQQQYPAAPAVHLQRDPVFLFPDKDYASYTDVRHLVALSGFESYRLAEGRSLSDDTPMIILNPEQPPSFPPHMSRFIWWSLEYGGKYEPDLSGWRGEVWASDPAWAQAHGAKMVVMGSHPDLNGDPLTPSYRDDKFHDVTMLGYMTPRRDALRSSLIASGISMPTEIYPGYGMERHIQLLRSRLMLHAHQDDARRAIAPQRFALCAAYRLPLVYEDVPDRGAYADYATFAPYERLASTVREYLAGHYDAPTETGIGERQYQWLCVENTFRTCVERALK